MNINSQFTVSCNLATSQYITDMQLTYPDGFSQQIKWVFSHDYGKMFHPTRPTEVFVDGRSVWQLDLQTLIDDAKKFRTLKPAEQAIVYLLTQTDAAAENLRSMVIQAHGLKEVAQDMRRFMGGKGEMSLPRFEGKISIDGEQGEQSFQALRQLSASK